MRDKPQQMLDISPKATVPVLQLDDATVIDESIDIIFWALAQADPLHLMRTINQTAKDLLEENDGGFKQCLDHYKYADRFPEQSETHYWQQASTFPEHLNARLAKHEYLLDNKISYLDIAIFPFIRQLAFVDKKRFDAMSWPYLQRWLDKLLKADVFTGVMHKYSAWQVGDEPVYMPTLASD